MRIKKKDLRKREAQLPINYPAPTVEGGFDYEAQKGRVENLCKSLAHNEVEVRDAVLAEIPRFLKEITMSTTTSSDEGEAEEKAHRQRVEMLMMKICLGLHYCYWHSDKPFVQHECAFQISQLLFAPCTNSYRMMFIRCFFRILCREWPKIDHYRIDKYMALVRKVVFQMICFLSQIEHGAPVRPVKLNAEGAFISAAEDPLPLKSKKATGKAAKTALDAFGNVLSEVKALFQDDVLENTTSVGLTMHLCDLFFDELARANVSADLFVALAESIPCFAMSRGNYVEKRVLDNFFGPLSAGILERRWIAERQVDIQRIYEKMCEVCRGYSVSNRTIRSVRVMFSEAQLLLQNKMDVTLGNDTTIKVRRTDMRRRIQNELEDVDRTRLAVAREREGLKDMRRRERKSAVRMVEKAVKTGAEVDPRLARIARAMEAKKKKRAVKATLKGSKRKKNIRITKKSLAEA